MMHCLNQSVSLRCRASRSLYFDDSTYFSDSRFETNPLLNSSSFGCSSCCFCCCAANSNSICNSNSNSNRLPRINPSFLCNGLRQSTLIQFSPSKRLIVHGRRRQSCNSTSRFSSCDSDRIYSFKERRRLGEGRYRYACWSYEDKKNERPLSNEIDDDYVNEVELLLDLLAEEVGLENIGVRDRKRIQKKDTRNIYSKTKTVNSGSVKRDLKCDTKATKAAEIRSSEKENRKLSNEGRAFVKEGNHERKKQASSCSSYYSVSSTGEYDSDNDVVVTHDDSFVKGESLSEYKDDRKMDSHIRVYDEGRVENLERQQEFGKKQSEILKKNTNESYYGNEEWRKKSEKRLNVESSQSQHTDRNSQQHSEKIDRITYQSQSGFKNKNSSTQKLYSDSENKLVTSVQELGSHHKGETSDFTRQNEYKAQSDVTLEASKVRNFDKKMASSSSSSSFETRMKNREENSTKVSDRFEDQREEKHESVEASKVRNFDKKMASSSSSFQTRMKNREENSTEVSDRYEDQREEKHQSVEASKIRNFDKKMASSSSSSFETRMKNREENSTKVSDRFEDQREEKHQTVGQLTSSKESRVKTQLISEISDTLLTNIENTSVSNTQSDIRTEKQELHLGSSSLLEKRQDIKDKYSSVSNTQSDIRTEKQELHLESSSLSERRQDIEDKYSSSQVAMVVGPTETMKTGRKTTKASSFHVGMPKEASSSYKALKLNPESSFQETGVHIASADEQQKSAGQFVEEFVEKAKHQLSISEDELASEDGEQHELKSSGENSSGNYDKKDGVKGPSDEMWHESGGPVNTSDELMKKGGRSLWNVIGDVVRLRWGPSRSETHTPKSGGVSNQSTSSERWFSGHEPDESSRKDVSTPSSSKEKQDSPLLLSSSNTNQGSSSKPMSPLVIEESSLPLPAIRMRRSPVVKTTSVTGETDVSTSGKIDQIIPKPLAQIPHQDASGSGKIVKVEPPIPSRRKLGRIDQMSKDRFDEWEEAYTIEAKQRKNDEFFMKEALSEAKKAGDLWEVPVGAVLVQDGKIIARGYNLVEELRDSTAHAEMVCIREASNKLHSWRLSGTTLYVTLEPCPMCAGAILQARIDTVVWGAPNKLLGADGSWIRLFSDGNGGNGSDKPPPPVHPFHPNMKVRRGVLSSECADVMQQFFQLRRKKKEKKPEAEPPSPPPPSCLPIAHHHHSKFVTKLHDAFSIMFCL